MNRHLHLYALRLALSDAQAVTHDTSLGKSSRNQAANLAARLEAEIHDLTAPERDLAALFPSGCEACAMVGG